MTDQEILYTMALTMALRPYSKHQRTLLEVLGSAAEIFENRRDLSRRALPISERMADALSTMGQLLPRCEQEMAYAQHHNIRITTIQDAEHDPTRLAQCDDAPLIIYTLGPANLNSTRIVSIVGTRRCTERGRDLCIELVRSLAEQSLDTLIVSGLAYGIDVAAHRAALSTGIPTVGVLACGLDEIYPRTHRSVAIEMLQRGGLVTEFMSHTNLDKVNFLQRNRIVAGLADATVIVESPLRGGSLNTARLANDYHREVFTFPGRPSDPQSEGCNLLIRRNNAVLLTSARDLLTDLGWQRDEALFENEESLQGTLFPELSFEEHSIVAALKSSDGELSASDLAARMDMAVYKITPLMLGLEMKGVVKILPGGRFHLCWS